jgi:hypothetical protein
MYGYGMYNVPVQMNVDRINNQIKELEELRNQYQNIPNQQPVNNIINASQQNQPSQKDMVEWRILNENEQVDNLYVQNKTLFINENMMVLKGVDGKLEKWTIKKVYPIDEKDRKIEELEKQVNELKEVIANGFNKDSKSGKTIQEFEQSSGVCDVNDDTTTKTTSRSVQTKTK